MARLAAGISYEGDVEWEIMDNIDLALKLPINIHPDDWVDYYAVSFNVLDANRGILYTDLEYPGGYGTFISLVDLVDGSLSHTVKLEGYADGDIGIIVASPKYALLYYGGDNGGNYTYTVGIIDTEDLTITEIAPPILEEIPANIVHVWVAMVNESTVLVNHLLPNADVISAVYDLDNGTVVWGRDLSELYTDIPPAYPGTIDAANGVFYVKRAEEGSLWIDVIGIEDGVTIASVETDYPSSPAVYFRGMKPLLLSHGGIPGIILPDYVTETANFIGIDGIKMSIPTNPDIVALLDLMSVSKPGLFSIPAAHVQDKAGVHFIPIVWEEGLPI